MAGYFPDSPSIFHSRATLHTFQAHLFLGSTKSPQVLLRLPVSIGGHEIGKGWE